MHFLSMLRFSVCDESGLVLALFMMLKCLIAAFNLVNGFLKCFGSVTLLSSVIPRWVASLLLSSRVSLMAWLNLCVSCIFFLAKPKICVLFVARFMRHFAYQCVISVLKACYLSLASPVFHCEGYMAISSANWLRCVSDLGSGMPDTQRLKSVGDMVAPVVSPPWVWGVDCVRGSPWNRSLCCWDSWEEKLRGHRNVNRKSRCSNCKTQASISL